MAEARIANFASLPFDVHVYIVKVLKLNEALIAERFSARHLIPLHCRIAFVCIYVQWGALVQCSTGHFPITYIHTGFCSAVRVVTPLSTFTLASSVHACFHCRRRRPWSGQERCTAASVRHSCASAYT